MPFFSRYVYHYYSKYLIVVPLVLDIQLSAVFKYNLDIGCRVLYGYSAINRMHVMQREIRYDSLETFISGLKNHSIHRIAFCETSEKRARQVEPHCLSVVHLDRVELLAYRDSILHKFVFSGADRDALFHKLVSAGFEVTRRSRNIT
jgi:hypothetical protein